MALERTAMMLDCYPDRADVPNAGVYVGTLAQILANYPEEVILAVTDPVRGVQTKCLYRPKASEIKSACEAEMTPLRKEFEQRRRQMETQRLLASAPVDRGSRPSIEKLREISGYADLGKGLSHLRKDVAEAKPKSFDELREYATADVLVSDTLAKSNSEYIERLNGDLK